MWLSTDADTAGPSLHRASGSWTPLPGGVPLRVSHFATTIDPTGEYVYLFGGLTSGSAVEARAWRFDTLLEEQTQLPDMLRGARDRMGGAYGDRGAGHIGVLGGLRTTLRIPSDTVRRWQERRVSLRHFLRSWHGHHSTHTDTGLSGNACIITAPLLRSLYVPPSRI